MATCLTGAIMRHIVAFGLVSPLIFDLHADPEKIVKGGGYWNSTLVGETEERSGEKPRTVIVKLKVSPVSAYALHVASVHSCVRSLHI